ncbi:uncharacterized protein LOC143435228 isoform X3 [Arvicanthis niloticus]|uniref:uncharacterized protein LOC143309518 isoform X3 n=1 Tax=Arvicanthis niloticus TaxID=61156 RepID=UPI00402B36A8
MIAWVTAGAETRECREASPPPVPRRPSVIAERIQNCRTKEEDNPFWLPERLTRKILAPGNEPMDSLEPLLRPLLDLPWLQQYKQVQHSTSYQLQLRRL